MPHAVARSIAAPSVRRPARRRALATGLLAAGIAAASACGGRPAPPPVMPQPDSAAIAESLAALAPPPVPRADAPRRRPALDREPVRLRLFVATTRRYADAERPGARFTTADADSLSFAFADVNVPSYRVRAEGEIPRPPATRDNRFAWRPDPSLDMYAAALLPAARDRWVQALDDDLAQTQARQVLVFVHGYNVAFEDACVRAAQLAADLGFDGTVVVFAWPSQGALSGYVRDQQNARNAGYHLAQLLRAVLPGARADAVHVLAHSMGSEVFSRAVTVLGADTLPRLAQAVFAAPDVDVRVFRREVLPALGARAARVTLYASDEDEALRASRALNGVWRLGLGGDSLVVLDGMDTIDASRVRGDALQHTLFGNSRFLSDLQLLLGEGLPPDRRRLLGLTRDGRPFWRFRGG